MNKEIIKYNGKQFLKDLNRVSDVMVWAPHTGAWIRTTKREARGVASYKRITYEITDKVFKVKRDVMVII